MISTARQTLCLSSSMKLLPHQSSSTTAVIFDKKRLSNKHYLDCSQARHVGSQSFLNLFKKLRHSKTPDPIESPRLTPHMVTDILRMNETHSIESANASGVIREVQCNQLQSNKPIEDRRIEAKLTGTDKYLFGVYDGHAGPACAQTLKERLFHYIAVAMADPSRLNELYGGEIKETSLVENLATSSYPEISTDLAGIQRDSLQNFANDCLDTHSLDSTVEECLLTAFNRLDRDISVEPSYYPGDTELSADLVNIAFSGSVGIVTYVDGLDLYVANVGDCQAVVGSHLSENDTWEATPLSFRHGAENSDEVQRLFSRHPNESNNILKNGRLFGGLMPLRAFGDNRYKWSKKDQVSLKNLAKESKNDCLSSYKNLQIPNNYRTPPYLDAEPEIIHYRLSPKDKFVVIATDGLWDSDGMSEDKVVSLVGRHIDGKQVLHSYWPPNEANLEDINDTLKKRKANLAKRTLDENAATHLLRHALGLEHGYVSAQLTLPERLVRQYRDDITITVIYFDSDYIMDYTRLREHV